MQPLRKHLPLFIALLLAAIALYYGPVAQLQNYHDFADQHTLFGIPHGADVLSNFGFALVALWGWRRLAPARHHPALAAGWAGYQLFLIGLLLTAFGSTWYHLDPDNARLVWDRLPITLACGGLLAGVWGDARQRNSLGLAAGLALAGMASVAWWYFTELAGSGDLRPYLLLQILPMLLIPLLQWMHGAPRAERWAFSGALLLYVFARFAEIYDHQIAAMLGGFTGHTLKHLLATAAAALVAASLVQRVRQVQASQANIKPVATTSGHYQ